MGHIAGAGSGRGRGGRIGGTVRQGSMPTIRYPSARAMQLFGNVRKSSPRRAQTGAYSLVQIAGPAGGSGRGGPGLGGGTGSTTQDASIRTLKAAKVQRQTFIGFNELAIISSLSCDPDKNTWEREIAFIATQKTPSPPPAAIKILDIQYIILF